LINATMMTESKRRPSTMSVAEQPVDIHSHGSMKEPLIFNSGDKEDGNENDDDMKPTKEATASNSRRRPNQLQELLLELQRRFPYLQKAREQLRRVPPRWRVLCVLFWVLWKFVAAYLIVYVVGHTSSWTRTFRSNNSSSNIDIGSTRYMASNINTLHSQSQSSKPIKILYIVTSLAEYDSGKRATTKGKDRLGHVLLPVLVDSVESMTMPHPFDATTSSEKQTSISYQVDVYLILAYTLTPARRAMIRDRLPAGVGLEIWDDSCPLGYDRKGEHPDVIQDNTRALARNHRYVIKDKLPYYDLFLAWEDDMRVTGPHVHQFLRQSQELDRLRAQAPEHVPDVPENMDPAHMKFFGPMTRQQLDRLIPGFVRVEVLLNETENGAQKSLDPIPLDYEFDVTKSDNNNNAVVTREERHFDPKPCCQVQMSPNDETPSHPATRDVVVWETSIKALSARQLPPGSALLDWVILLPGPGKRLPKNQLLGGYWSGRDGAFGDEIKPSPGMPDLIAQQGGWMATREQIMRLHTGLCQGAFVPPYDEPIYRRDGQESMNVEFYSGGYQFFTGVLGGCNMQRIVSMHPDHFSKHFIYHVANNKQRQLAARRMVRADSLFGQLNTLKKRAEKAKASVQSSS
jgi:hypothetical protein